MKIDTIIERGKFMRDISDAKKLAFYSENAQKIENLYGQFRFEWTLGRDDKALSPDLKDWVIIGKRGQIFEYGIHKLGFSVEGTPTIKKIKAMQFATCSQNGDGEANFWCEWSSDNETFVKSIIKPCKRREAWSRFNKTDLETICNEKPCTDSQTH